MHNTHNGNVVTTENIKNYFVCKLDKYGIKYVIKESRYNKECISYYIVIGGLIHIRISNHYNSAARRFDFVLADKQVYKEEFCSSTYERTTERSVKIKLLKFFIQLRNLVPKSNAKAAEK